MRAATLRAVDDAAQIVEEAKREAACLLETAREKTRQIHQRAKNEAELDWALALLESRRILRRQLAQSEGKLTELALRIAEKVIGEELRLYPGRVALIVEASLREMLASQRMVIRVHPADLASVEAALPRLRSLSEAEMIALEPDPLVERGGCIVESELGQVDGQIKTQLEALAAALAKSPDED